MASAYKDLTALNSTLQIDEVDESNGSVTLQYITGGAGTVVLEGTLGSGSTAEWVGLKLTNANTKVDADNAIAAGLYYASMYGYRSVRARKSVGVASCPVWVSVNNATP